MGTHNLPDVIDLVPDSKIRGSPLIFSTDRYGPAWMNAQISPYQSVWEEPQLYKGFKNVMA